MPLFSGVLRTAVRAALVGLVAVEVVASTGCLVRRRKIDTPQRSSAPLLTAGLEQLTQNLERRYAAIETLSATVDLEPTLISASKGEITDYKDVRGYILLRKPAWIRVIALYPVVRATAFDMVSDGRTFRLHLPSRNLFLIGQNRIDAPSPKKIENLRPQHLLEALVIRPPDPATERALIENWTDGAASYLVHIVRREEGGRLKLARKIWFDRTSLEVFRQQVFDAAGDMVTDARYAEWEKHANSSYPKRVVVTRPKDEYELSIRFLRTSLNEPLGDDKFQLEQPPGVKVERVGEGDAAKRPAGGGSGG